MSKFRKVQILRTFSANDWNHPESKHFVSLTLDPQSEMTPSFSSNAEKLRKTDSFQIKQN